MALHPELNPRIPAELLWLRLPLQPALLAGGARRSLTEAVDTTSSARSRLGSWGRMRSEQRAGLEPALTRFGLAPELVARAAAYVAEAEGLSAALDATVLIHGDLSHLNFTVEHAAATGRSPACSTGAT